MSYYRNCPYCGAYLDPGERCECELDREERPIYRSEKIRPTRAEAPASPRYHSSTSKRMRV